MITNIPEWVLTSFSPFLRDRVKDVLRDLQELSFKDQRRASSSSSSSCIQRRSPLSLSNNNNINGNNNNLLLQQQRQERRRSLQDHVRRQVQVRNASNGVTNNNNNNNTTNNNSLNISNKEKETGSCNSSRSSSGIESCEEQHHTEDITTTVKKVTTSSLPSSSNLDGSSSSREEGEEEGTEPEDTGLDFPLLMQQQNKERLEREERGKVAPFLEIMEKGDSKSSSSSLPKNRMTFSSSQDEEEEEEDEDDDYDEGNDEEEDEDDLDRKEFLHGVMSGSPIRSLKARSSSSSPRITEGYNSYLSHFWVNRSNSNSNGNQVQRDNRLRNEVRPSSASASMTSGSSSGPPSSSLIPVNPVTLTLTGISHSCLRFIVDLLTKGFVEVPVSKVDEVKDALKELGVSPVSLTEDFEMKERRKLCNNNNPSSKPSRVFRSKSVSHMISSGFPIIREALQE